MWLLPDGTVCGELVERSNRWKHVNNTGPKVPNPITGKLETRHTHVMSRTKKDVRLGWVESLSDGPSLEVFSISHVGHSITGCLGMKGNGCTPAQWNALPEAFRLEYVEKLMVPPPWRL